MKVIELDGNTLFLHGWGVACHKTHIQVSEDYDVIIGFNPSSSLYNEKNFIISTEELAEMEAKGEKWKSSITRPFEFNRFYMFKRSDKLGTGP